MAVSWSLKEGTKHRVGTLCLDKLFAPLKVVLALKPRVLAGLTPGSTTAVAQQQLSFGNPGICCATAAAALWPP